MAGIHNVQLWTYTLSASDIEFLTPEYSFTTISILAKGGEVQISCNGVANGIASSPITLVDGQSLTIEAGQGNTIEYVYILAEAEALIIAR
jgi:hypothetical protein